MPPVITGTVFPCGGIIMLNITIDPSLDLNTTTITLYRSTNGGPNEIIYQGVDTPRFVDDGENLPSYLDFTSTYTYTIDDGTGTATSDVFVPASQLTVVENYFDKLLFRAFSAGVNSLVVPKTYKKIRVLQAMPLTWGSEDLPMLTMNLDLDQQEETQIGQALNASENNFWTIPVIVFRRYSISILSQDARERNYYRDACKAVFYSIFQPLIELGDAVTYRYQVAQSQVQDNEMSPGFYEAVFMMDFSGIFNVLVQTNFPIIEGIEFDPTFVPANISATYTQISGWKITIA